MLVERVIIEARAIGCKSIVLDSLPSLSAALSLYRKLGFRDCAPYNDNPASRTVFMELKF